MPIAMIHILEGRDDAKKRMLIDKVSQAIAESLDAPLASIRVLVTELPKSHWGVGGVSIADKDG